MHRRGIGAVRKEGPVRAVNDMNKYLGPTLPAFLSPNVAKVLVENFGIAGIGTVDDDLKLLIGETA